jgi:hypothetical protein
MNAFPHIRVERLVMTVNIETEEFLDSESYQEHKKHNRQWSVTESEPLVMFSVRPAGPYKTDETGYLGFVSVETYRHLNSAYHRSSGPFCGQTLQRIFERS